MSTEVANLYHTSKSMCAIVDDDEHFVHWPTQMTLHLFFQRELFIPYVFATCGAVASAIALKETVVKVHKSM